MSNFNRFMKKNKIQKENAMVIATKSLCDKEGVPLEWTIRPLTTKENDVIRDDCTRELQVTGKPGMFRQKLDGSKYMAKIICASVVEPNLNDKELQDSYGVMTPEDLLKEMIDGPGEYAELTSYIQNFNGFSTMEEKVEEAKN